MVKLGVVTPSTAPDDPPSDGADRTLDPPLPGPGAPDCATGAAAVDEGAAAVAEGDVEQPAASPITPISAPAAIQRPFLFDSNRRTFGPRACLAVVTEADASDEDAGGDAGSKSFMMALLLLWQLLQRVPAVHMKSL
jgi:hypothetical protein